MIRIIFIIIKLFELLIFWIVGKRLSNQDDSSSYWSVAKWAVISFALVDGLRYGRWIDYWGYLNIYNTMHVWNEWGYDVLFTGVMFLFKQANLGLAPFLIIQSGFYMFSCLLFFKPYKENFQFLLPLLLVFSNWNENFARWFFALGFLLVALSFYRDKKFLLAIFFIIPTYLSHSGVAFLLFALFILPILDREHIPVWGSIPIFVIAQFSVSISSLSFLTSVSTWVLQLGLLENNTSVTHLKHMEDLIAGNYLTMGIHSNPTLAALSSLVQYIPIIYFFPKIVSWDKWEIAMYNLFVITITINPILNQVELLGRFSISLLIICSIIPAIMYTRILLNNEINSIALRLALVSSLLLMIYPLFSYIFLTSGDEKMMFVWDI